MARRSLMSKFRSSFVLAPLVLGGVFLWSGSSSAHDDCVLSGANQQSLINQGAGIYNTNAWPVDSKVDTSGWFTIQYPHCFSYAELNIHYWTGSSWALAPGGYYGCFSEWGNKPSGHTHSCPWITWDVGDGVWYTNSTYTVGAQNHVYGHNSDRDRFWASDCYRFAQNRWNIAC
jgi:hypothetical protein